MEKGVRVLFWLFIIHGQAFVKQTTAQPDQLSVQPAIWIKGCHQKPTSVLKTLSLANNEPGRCLLCCGPATQIVALQLDECICLTNASKITPARGQSLCNNPCSGDGNLKCGGLSTWSIYQRVTNMKLPPDATGCGVAWMSSKGYAYKMVLCNTSSSLVCINRYTGCEDRYGDSTWFEGVTECGDMSAILPYQSLCQTVTNHNSYWLGLYRSKANTQRCETTTIATQSTGNPTEHYSFVTKATTTRHETNEMSEMTTETHTTQPSESTLPGLISEAETTTTQFLEPTRTPYSETSLSRSMEPEHSVTKASLGQTDTLAPNHITTELYHDTTESPTATENFETNVRSSSAATSTSNELSTVNRHLSVLSTLKEQTIPFGPSTLFKTAIRSISNGQSSTTSSVTAKNKKQTSSLTEAMHPSTPNAKPNMKSEVENVEVKPSRELNTIDSSEKLTIAVSVVGTVLSTLLLAIFLMLCRISRILQNNRYKSINRPQMKNNHTPMNMSYLTDGVSSYPLHRTHDLVGRQQSPFLYGSDYRPRAQPRERASNMYIPWTVGRSARRGTLRNTCSTLDRKSDYSDARGGSLDENIMVEGDERYYEPV